jgi:polyisoprenoid-binding protein YceI
MKQLIVIMAILFTAQLSFGQKYFSKTGKISFYSDAPMEKIEAHNTTASSVLDLATGNMEWAVLIQGFKFEKALMQDHFNENYMESSTYPKAKFKGKIDNLSDVSFKKDGTYNVNVSGQLEIHGVSKAVTAAGVVTVKGGNISVNSKFPIQIADYDIQIPGVVAEKIAKKVDITVQADYQPMPTN